MVRRVSLAAVVALGGTLLLSGCQSNSYTCVNGECHVTVTGSGQSIEVNDIDLTVSEITDQGMTISAEGSAPMPIAVGQRVRVGPAEITVTSVEGDKVKFDLR
ncbi:hypothetical protein BZB76_1194 [Actinomadura pelletieri DSM 43383]|uniref:Uncharacterized protein n=1 Tax=Actinomadura pelletieri DSM 43383 TaxID=1120940 RepID=A0A495R062_9ACTN|nr:hypothetical protein [Actinomadura pelletieri]RKS79717.1 hypothetical protein BZB76_1194 [Actinomadura pelletieri DSM 43383]